MVRFRKHIISTGDTIQSIAQKELGDMSRWQELVQFNNLRYPYIVDTLEEKLKNPNHLLTVGDMILIHTESDGDTSPEISTRSLPDYDEEEIFALALGKDLDIMPMGDQSRHGLETLEMKDDHKGDIGTIRGINNLKQALLVKLTTPRGSYLGHPNFGSDLHRLLGRKNTEGNIDRINIEIERTLRTDRRVTQVRHNESVVRGNVLMTSFTVVSMTLEEAFEFIIAAREDGEITLLDNFYEA